MGRSGTDSLERGTAGTRMAISGTRGTSTFSTSSASRTQANLDDRTHSVNSVPPWFAIQIQSVTVCDRRFTFQAFRFRFSPRRVTFRRHRFTKQSRRVTSLRGHESLARSRDPGVTPAGHSLVRHGMASVAENVVGIQGVDGIGDCGRVHPNWRMVS